jgi:pimeloyl-ACP methyl ester carboxylesterase
VPFELPEDPRTARRTAIWRWVSFALVALLVALVAYLVYVGFVGSGQVVEPPGASTDCRTPRVAYAWAYEAINYDLAADDAVAGYEDPSRCPEQGEAAGGALQTSDGMAIAGWYIPAGDGAGPSAATVILAHGHGSNKSAMLPWAEVLHEDYNLVLFDFRNHGQSEDAQTTVGLTEQRDLDAVLDWLVAAKGPEQVAVLGVSMGGAAAVNEAVRDGRVAALVLDATHATLANALQARLERAGYPLGLPAAWSVLMGGLVRTGQDMSAGDPVQAIERYGEGGRPVLIIGGGRDDAIGRSDAADLLAAAQAGGAAAELQVCDAAGHAGSVSACPDEYREWVLGFLSRSLSPSS